MFKVFSSALLVAAATAITGVDVSTSISQSDWECLNVDWASVRAYSSTGSPDYNAAGTIKAARAAGVSDVSAYIFPCVSCGDGGKQVNDTIYYLNKQDASPDRYWYDVERYNWSSNLASNQAFITDMIEEGKKQGIKAGIYTNYYNWQEIVGLDWSYPADQGLPLWYAHYDNSASFSDFEAFGGWSSPSIKQYEGDKSSCGVGIDYDYMKRLTIDEPEWSNGGLMNGADFVAGFLYALTGENHLTEIEACYQGGSLMVGEIEAGIADIKKGGWDYDVQAALQFALVALQIPQTLNTCENMDEDLAAIKDWASIFTNPAQLAATVTTHYLLHKKAIQADISALEADYSAGLYFKAGADLADALTLAVGPIESTGPVEPATFLA